MNIWRPAGLITTFLGLVLIFLMAFPSMLPGTDSTVGPAQLFVFVLGIAAVAAGIDIFRSVLSLAELNKYFYQYKSAYGFWLAGSILYYLTVRLVPLYYASGREVQLLKWACVFLVSYGLFSFFKLKLPPNDRQVLNSDILRFLKPAFWLKSPEIAACFCYGVYGLSLLAPLASNTILPEALDFANHTAIIVQARAALDEGQFPLFVAPWQFSGWRLPLFQFYSPLPYAFAGLVYKWLTPGNPYLAFKLILWLSFTVSGIFIYKSAFWLTRSRMAAFLSGMIYMSAPYFLINTNVRGAFTEAIAQGILPISLYFNLRTVVSPKLRYTLLSAILWFALATTHTITFVYFTLFLGTLVLFISTKKIMRLMKFGIAFVIGCALGVYYLVPVASADYLRINNRINTSNPYQYSWLTHIETLLAPTSVSPIPEPWPVGGTPKLNPAVGWPILLAAGILVYYRLSRATLPYKVGTYRLIFPLLLLFGLAFLMAWSPVDFWKYLPQQFWVIQLPYRLLAQIGWIGSILAAYALAIMFGTHFDIRTTVIGLLLIQASLSSYLPTPQRSPVELSELIQRPDMGYGRWAYLIQNELYPYASSYGNIELPARTADGWLKLIDKIHFFFPPSAIRSDSILHFEGSVAEELINGTTLSIFINNHEVLQKKLMPGSFVWDVFLQDIIPHSSSFALSFGADKTFTPPDDQRPLAIRIHSLAFRNLDSKVSVLPVAATQSSCTQKGVVTSCSVSLPKGTRIVQLPVLFYPDLLDVRVDGNPAPYFPLTLDEYLLVGTQLERGTHRIDIEFKGITWARWGSRLAWIGMLILLALDQIFVFKFNKPIWQIITKKQEQK